MLGKPPTLDPSMEDVAVAAPLPTPPVVGRVPAAAERGGRQRRATTTTERESRRRREATATEGTGWGHRRRIQCRRCGCLLLPSYGRHGHLESARWRWMRRIGGTGMRRRYGGWRWIGRGKLLRAPKSSACARHRLLPARDPSAPSPLEDEAVQRSCRRLFRLGAQEKAVASRGDGARLNGGFPVKMPITETGKGRRCTCLKGTYSGRPFPSVSWQVYKNPLRFA